MSRVTKDRKNRPMGDTKKRVFSHFSFYKKLTLSD